MLHRMLFIEKTCKNCTASFQCSMKEHKRGHGHFCSVACFRQFMKNRPKPPAEMNCVCVQCEIPFHRPLSHLKNSKSGLLFCSRGCKEKAQRLNGGMSELHPPHYGVGEKSYQCIAKRSYIKRCFICGYDQLEAALHVHHIDENRKNSAVENLAVLCSVCHTEVHHGMHDGLDWNRLQKNHERSRQAL